MIIDNEKLESVSHDRNLELKLREGLEKQKKVDLSTIGWVDVFQSLGTGPLDFPKI